MRGPAPGCAGCRPRACAARAGTPARHARRPGLPATPSTSRQPGHGLRGSARPALWWNVQLDADQDRQRHERDGGQRRREESPAPPWSARSAGRCRRPRPALRGRTRSTTGRPEVSRETKHAGALALEEAERECLQLVERCRRAGRRESVRRRSPRAASERARRRASAAASPRKASAAASSGPRSCFEIP